MKENNVRRLLLVTVLVMTGVPLMAAFYFLNATLERSLNLGFNPQVARALDDSARNLKTLKTADPANEALYRQQFEMVSRLTQVYTEPGELKQAVRRSLRMYFGIGLIGAMLMAVIVAALLSRRISRSYAEAFHELMAQRDRVAYLEQMASWQHLARILAHEIKNPLTPIEVLVTSLSRAYSSKSAEEFGNQLTQAQVMIGEELNHLKRTVSRFSDFAKLPEPELRVENPAQLVRSHVAALSTMFEGAEITVDATESAGDARARIDSALLRQVLSNIIANGVEANPARRVAFLIRVECTPERVHIELSNDGVPVPPALASRIFDPYLSGTGGRDNMGLGLSIVKKVMIEHGGEINYAERNGRPCFTLCFDRVEPANGAGAR
jgi:signal transduction histidine kinase